MLTIHPRLPHILASARLARAHRRLDPSVFCGKAQHAKRAAGLAGQDTWAGRVHKAQADAFGATAQILQGLDALLGTSSPRQPGLLGQAAWVICALGAAVLCFPTVLCGDQTLSIGVRRGVHHSLLKLFVLPCALSAAVGLVAKTVATAGTLPLVFCASLIGQAFETVYPLDILPHCDVTMRA